MQVRNLSLTLLVIAIVAVLSVCSFHTRGMSSPGERVIVSRAPVKEVQGWEDLGLSDQLQSTSAPSTTSFTVLLQQRNLDELRRLSESVADPKSPEYGKFLTPKQIADLTYPTPADQARALEWLKTELKVDDSHLTNVGDAIQVRGVKVSDAARAFQCTMHAFRQLTTAEATTESAQPRIIHRCVSDISVPKEVSDVVVGSVGLADFPTRYHGGPHPHPIPVGPSPAVGPVLKVPHRRVLRDPKQMHEIAMRYEERKAKERQQQQEQQQQQQEKETEQPPHLQ